MTPTSIVKSTLLSRLNERQVFRTIQAVGPVSRAEAARRAGISSPTACKAIDSLLRAGLLDEGELIANVRGRPARRIGLALDTVCVLGLVVDAGSCHVVSARLDGLVAPKRTVQFPTPPTYDSLVKSVSAAHKRLTKRSGARTLGMGISLPGLMDSHAQVGLLSPHVPITNGRALSLDLTERLGIDCAMVQESHALCLAERHFGLAPLLDDFAVLDVSTGVGLGVISGGRLLSGHSGFAGEIGHATVLPDGPPCPCGNTGCLETVASDVAFVRSLASRLGRELTVDEAIVLVAEGHPAALEEIARVRRYLAICVANVVNLYNPANLFVRGRLFAENPGFLAHVIEEAKTRALGPPMSQCTIRLGKSTKTQGAIAAIIDHLLDRLAPGIVDSSARVIPHPARPFR